MIRIKLPYGRRPPFNWCVLPIAQIGYAIGEPPRHHAPRYSASFCKMADSPALWADLKMHYLREACGNTVRM
ncbi:MAG: hypothetical protein R2822_10960 [Spirosomataceae bacterium]